MEIVPVTENRRAYLPLLLLADEQEEMIETYLDRGEMILLQQEGTPYGVCVVTQEGEHLVEIKNLAVLPQFQRQGLGRTLVQFVFDRFGHPGAIVQVGTGESPLTLPFYEACGFSYSHRVKDFFLQHYDHPIVEEGVLLRDMVYLRRYF